MIMMQMRPISARNWNVPGIEFFDLFEETSEMGIIAVLLHGRCFVGFSLSQFVVVFAAVLMKMAQPT